MAGRAVRLHVQRTLHSPIKAAASNTRTVPAQHPATDRSGLSQREAGPIKHQGTQQQQLAPAPIATSAYIGSAPVPIEPTHVDNNLHPSIRTHDAATKPSGSHVEALASRSQEGQDTALDQDVAAIVEATQTAPVLKASRVPSSRVARLFQYGSLAAGLGVGAAGATLQRLTSGGGSKARTSPLLTEGNIRRIVSKLSRMRGAALKLGQFLSIQESQLLPPEMETILARVQNAADYMPEWQTRSVLEGELGHDWRNHFATFDMMPFAAASIGQVHKASLPDGRQVAVKVQFPGVAESIDADISTLKGLLALSAVLPKGLYLENTLRVMRRELKDECDYVREAECARRFKVLLQADSNIAVPKVIDHLCTAKVLTAEMMQGRPLSKSAHLNQSTKDHIGSVIIGLCLRELFHFRFMQTDPNWSNFLWNERTSKLELIDFGASQSYTLDFIDKYKKLLLAAIDKNRIACEQVSRDIGYLTSEDSQDMVDAHIEAMLALAEPFKSDRYHFGTQTITKRIQALIPIMLNNRTTPPPEATYSLNRKLSGSFLLCSRLGAHIDCRHALGQVVGKSQTF